jgi:hypothetical protein
MKGCCSLFFYIFFAKGKTVSLYVVETTFKNNRAFAVKRWGLGQLFMPEKMYERDTLIVWVVCLICGVLWGVGEKCWELRCCEQIAVSWIARVHIVLSLGMCMGFESES